MVKSSKKRPRGRKRLGVWLIVARGGLATTLITGSLAIAKKLRKPVGLLTETPFFDGFPLTRIEDLVFGGHDIRETTTREAALEVGEDSGSIPPELVRVLNRAFRKVDSEIRPGILVNSGKAIEGLADQDYLDEGRSLAEMVEGLRTDLREFRDAHGLERVVVVNLGSTEPPLRIVGAHKKLGRFEEVIAANQQRLVRPSLLYAYAAAKEGCPFIHFTPSEATLAPALVEAFDESETPFMGRDGKTGETLVKSALAPMFKYRNLQVLSWQGYNLLGDRDGKVLSQAENLDSKIQTKDSLLKNILGYPLHTHVGIDYVPSLGDQKTAWDFIHFEGFLGHRMSMQFTWQGCDAVLAAPLVLDMVRLMDHVASTGATGPQTWLACFFKRPFGMEEDDLHRQWHLLEEQAARMRSELPD